MEIPIYCAVINHKNTGKETKFYPIHSERDAIRYLKMLTGYQKNFLDIRSAHQRIIVMGGLDEKYNVTYEDHETCKAWVISIGKGEMSKQWVRIAKPSKLEVTAETCIGFDTTARALKYFFFNSEKDPTCNWSDLSNELEKE